MSDARRDLSEWTAFRDKRAEVQIRTATQHAWAAVDHRLTYKSNHEIPRELQRRFARLSAILELADDQFSQLRQEHDALEARYSDSCDPAISTSRSIQRLSMLISMIQRIRSRGSPRQQRRKDRSSET